MGRASGSFIRIGCFVLSVFCPPAYAGSLDPSLAPAPTMYTLTDLYNRISSGTSAGTHSLSPDTAPGSTMYTLDAIYTAMPGGDETTAAARDVRSGKTFIMRDNGVLQYVTGTASHEVPASGSTTTYTNYDDAYNEQQSAGFSSTDRTMSYTMYNYAGGNLVQTSDVNQSSVTVDNRTGLMWMTDGLMVGTKSWADAITWCRDLNSTGGYAGYTDWRLPNYRELSSIVYYNRTAPAIDTAYFRNTPNNLYWTSTTYAGATTAAWAVSFSGGYVDYSGKSNSCNVRAVREGP